MNTHTHTHTSPARPEPNRPANVAGFNFEYPGSSAVRIWRDGECIEEIALSDDATPQDQADVAWEWLNEQIRATP